MLFTTSTQFVILALLFIAGWLFGLASHPGGRRWKTRYIAERDAHAAARREQDARLAEVRADRDTRLASADQRHAELEREHGRLVKAAPVTAATVAPVRPRTQPVYAPGEKRGWFDSVTADRL